MAKEDELLALKFEGKRYDIGNKLDYLTTMIEFAVERPDFGLAFKDFLKKFVKQID
jgi:UTP--glucose-1-phosphate uridylyltransferase